MALELHPNDCSRHAKPGIWIFQGRSVICLVIGAAAFISIFRVLYALYVDWFIALPVSLVPLALMTLIVHFLINGRAPSFAEDLLFQKIWEFKTWLYLSGCLDKAPLLWIEFRKPQHPFLF